MIQVFLILFRKELFLPKFVENIIFPVESLRFIIPINAFIIHD